MTIERRLIVLGVLGTLGMLAACAVPGEPSPSTSSGGPVMTEPETSESSKPLPSLRLVSPRPSAPPRLGNDEITGTLGFEDIEGGCATFESQDGTRYEVLYPEGWELQRSPLQLLSPDGEVVARPGDEITIRGSQATDVSSICQVGPIFRATEVVIP